MFARTRRLTAVRTTCEAHGVRRRWASRLALTAALCACAAAAPAQARWSHAERISPAGAEVGWPAVAMNVWGDATAVWVRDPFVRPPEPEVIAQPEPVATPSVESAKHRAHGRWSAPELVGPSPQGAPEALDVAVDARGGAALFFTGRVAETTGLPVAALRDSRGGWSPPTVLSRELEPLIEFPGATVVMDARGDAVAVWADSFNGGAWAAVHRAGSAGWSDPELLSDPPSDPNRRDITLNASVAMSPGGEVVAVWSNVSPIGPAVQAATWNSRSGTWSAPETLDPGPNAQVGSIGSVGLDARGDAITTWARVTSEGTVIQVAERVAGVWSPSRSLSAPPSPLLSLPQVAVGARGDAVAIWTDSGVGRIAAATRTRRRGWSQPEFVGFPGSVRGRPRAAVDAFGTAVLAWLARTAHGGVAAIAERHAGGGWSEPRELGPAETSQEVALLRSSIDLALSPLGRGVAVWLTEDHGLLAATRKPSKWWPDRGRKPAVTQSGRNR